MKPTVVAGITLFVLITTSLVISSVGAQNAVETKPDLVQWEYTVVSVPAENGFLQGYKLQPRLNKLGLDGWECVGVMTDVRKDQTHGHVILKRPKQ